MFLGYGLKIIVQAGYFILIARALGPAEYGAFVGTVALIALVAPFGSLGAGNLLVQNVSRNRELFAEYWGNALFALGGLWLGLSGLGYGRRTFRAAYYLFPGCSYWWSVFRT